MPFFTFSVVFNVCAGHGHDSPGCPPGLILKAKGFFRAQSLSIEEEDQRKIEYSYRTCVDPRHRLVV